MKYYVRYVLESMLITAGALMVYYGINDFHKSEDALELIKSLVEIIVGMIFFLLRLGPSDNDISGQ